MSASNTRVNEYSTVYHLTSRIAHRVFILNEDERNDLIEMIRRSAQFCGIKLLAWCIMTNHFHLLVYLPAPVPLSEEDILSRYAILKGQKGRELIEVQLAQWRTQGETGEQLCQKWFDRQRARMYNIGEFMKINKQWFTEEYNRRNAHVGTLWESTYHERIVEWKDRGVEKCVAYIHLNPIRGAICSGYSDYIWSSMTALARGDVMALDGMRFVYDAPDASADELIARHTQMLDALLESEKRRRAEEIARRRAAGYNVPCDPLTTEAMISLAAAQRERILQSGVELSEETAKYKKCAEIRENAERRILELVKMNATISPGEMSKALSIPSPTIYKYLRDLAARGILTRAARASPWTLSELYI